MSAAAAATARPSAGVSLPNLAHVGSLVEVIDAGGFHEAARRRLGLAQSTVSAQVRAVETAVGCVLVMRSVGAPRASIPRARSGAPSGLRKVA